MFCVTATESRQVPKDRAAFAASSGASSSDHVRKMAQNHGSGFFSQGSAPSERTTAESMQRIKHFQLHEFHQRCGEGCPIMNWNLQRPSPSSS